MDNKTDSTKRNEPRRHHYIPQFLLRRFANDEDQVKTADLKTGRTYSQPVRKAAAVRDYNATYDEAGNRTQVAEILLGKMEDYFAPIIDLLVRGELSAPRLAPESIRRVIATFVLVQWGRTPAGREVLSRPADAQLKKQLRDLGPEGFREALTNDVGDRLDETEVQASWESLTDFEFYRFTDYNSNLIREMLIDVKESAVELSSRAWSLIEWERRGLAIGDQPVITFPAGYLDHGTVNRPEDIGRVKPTEADVVMMPMSRRKALVILAAPELDGRYIVPQRGTTSREKFFNYLTLVAADQYVFSHPDDDVFYDLNEMPALREPLVISLEKRPPSSSNPSSE